MVLEDKLKQLRNLFFKKVPFLKQEAEDFVNWAAVAFLEGRNMKTQNYWILYDYLREKHNWSRAYKLSKEIKTIAPKNLNNFADNDSNKNFDTVENIIYMEQIRKYLTDKEYSYIYDMVVNEMNMAEVAEKNNISIQGVYGSLKYTRARLKASKIQIEF